MSKMISLELPKKKKESIDATIASMPDMKYPYGTKIELRDEMAKKFSMLEDVNVGDQVKIIAIGTITLVRKEERKSEYDKEMKNTYEVDIQLTDMKIDEDSESQMDKGFAEASKDTKEE